MLADLLLAAVGAPVDLADPINRAHRLNVGRVGWWMGLPGTSGGKFLHDLCGLAPGTFANPSASGVRWATTGARLGGVDTANPYINGQGTSNNITVGNQPQFQITTNITVGCWARWKSATVSNKNTPLIAKWGASPGYTLTTDATTADRMDFAVRAGGLTKTAAVATTYGGDTWHRFIGTYDGANVILYADGVSVASTAATGAIANPSSVLTFGNYSDGGTNSTTFVGHLDDLTISNRAWSASEVAEDYVLSQQGYPGVLRRLPIGDTGIASAAADGRLLKRWPRLGVQKEPSPLMVW